MTPGQGRPLAIDAAWTTALCAGVLVVLHWPTLPSWPLALSMFAMALACAGFAFSGRRDAAAAVRAAWWSCAGLLGASLCAWHGQLAMAQRVSVAAEGNHIVAEVRVLGLPEARRHGGRFTAEVLRTLEGPEGLEGKRLAARWHGGGQALQPGEVWRLALRLGVVRPPGAPGQGDAGRRALEQGVDGTATVDSAERPLRLGSAEGVDALRDAVQRAISSGLGPSRARYVAALAVGDTRGLDESDWAWLRRFGLTHLIAISGFHVGMVAGLGVLAVRAAWWVWPGFGKRWRRTQAAAWAATAVAFAYAALAGFSLPTVRTVLMVAVVALIVAARRRTPPAQPLVLGVAIIVLADPFALLSPGFWLSCGGVAWLLWCLPGTTSVLDLRAFLRAQWVATLGLMPIAAAFFLEVPVAGMLANLLAIPWISLVVVPLSLLGTLLLPLSESAASWPWALAASAMAGFEQVLQRVPAPLVHPVALPEPGPFVVVLAVVGAMVALLPRGLRWRHAGWLLMLPLLAPASSSPRADRVELVVLPVGQGDAVLLRSRDATVLVDAGPATLDLPRRLNALGVRQVDLRIETRGNAGRRGGAARVGEAWPPAAVWRAPSAGRDGLRCEAGMQRDFGAFRILAVHPDPGLGALDPAEACVLRVVTGHAEAWLVSDAGRWVAARRSTAASERSVGLVIGAPASLHAWQGALHAPLAIATRAPGPSLSRRWPTGLHRVDREGALTVMLGEAGPPTAWRASRRRWWDGPPP